MQNTKTIESEFLSRIGRHQGILHKICFVYSNSRADRDDLYQEIVLQLWKYYSSFKGESEFSTWMYKVALNTAISLTQKPSLFTYSTDEKEIALDTEHSMDLNEEIQVLYKAISQLRKVEKAIVLLWLEERSYEEIADTIGITVKSVSVKLVRVKAKLAEIIKKLQ